MSLRHADPLMARGWASVPTQVIVQTNLSVGARLLYTLILSYLNTQAQAWPGQERLAYELGVTDRTVRTWMNELRDAGMVSDERRGLGMSNLYTVTGACTLPQPPEWEPSVSERTSASGQDRKSTSAARRKPASDEPGLVEPGPVQPSHKQPAREGIEVVPPPPPLPPELDKAAVTLQQAGMGILDPTILIGLAESNPQVDIAAAAMKMATRYRGRPPKHPFGMLRTLVEADDAPKRAVDRHGKPLPKLSGAPTAAERERQKIESAAWHAANPNSDGGWEDIFGPRETAA